MIRLATNLTFLCDDKTRLRAIARPIIWMRQHQMPRPGLRWRRIGRRIERMVTQIVYVCCCVNYSVSGFDDARWQTLFHQVHLTPAVGAVMLIAVMSVGLGDVNKTGPISTRTSSSSSSSSSSSLFFIDSWQTQLITRSKKAKAKQRWTRHTRSQGQELTSMTHKDLA